MKTPCKTVAITLLVLSAGCGKPQAGPENLELISSLRTAVSAENEEWLEQNVQAIEKRHDSGKMSDRAYEALQAIVRTAREGQWESAEKKVIALQQAQRPDPDHFRRGSHSHE